MIEMEKEYVYLINTCDETVGIALADDKQEISKLEEMGFKIVPEEVYDAFDSFIYSKYGRYEYFIKNDNGQFIGKEIKKEKKKQT